MADEKTTPTPKVPGAAADTMHSKPETPDRSRGEGVDAPDPRTLPPSNTSSVGSERPHKTTIKSKDDHAGTLVEDIPALDTPDPATVNVPPAEPDKPIALQPGEPLDTNTREMGDKRETKLRTGKATRSTSSSSKKSSAKADK